MTGGWGATLIERLWTGGWQGVIVVAIVWTVSRTLKSLSPKVRYWFWWVACLKLLLVFLPVWSIPLPARANVPVPQTWSAGVQTLAKPPFLVAGPTPDGTHATTIASNSWMDWAAIIWLIGVALGVTLLAREWMSLRKTLRGSNELTHQPLAARVRVLAVQMGLSRPPKIYLNSWTSSPFVAGIFGPCLVLPEKFESTLQPKEQDVTIAHELSHLKRRDLMFGLVPSLARLLFFFFPPVYLACREWATEREACCDADAIALTKTRARDYGDLLIKIVSDDHSPALSPCLGATASFYTLKRRIALMKSYDNKPSFLLRALATTLVLASALTLISWRSARPENENLLKNSSVDADSSGWDQGAQIDGVRYAWSKSVSHSGDGSLSISKSAEKYFPIAQWSQSFPYTGSEKGLKVSAFVKAKNMTKAILDVQFIDETGKTFSHQWVSYIGQKTDSDPVATHDWQEYSGYAKIPEGTKTIAVGLQDYGPGSIWFDDVSANYATPPVEASPTGSSMVANAGFEQGLQGWTEDAFPPTATGQVNVQTSVVPDGHTGKALMFSKTENRYFPVELYTQDLPSPAGKTKIDISAWVKAQNASKATIQIFFNRGMASESRQWGVYVGAQNAGDPPANHDWKKYDGAFDIPAGTVSVSIALEMYGPGTVWFDDIAVNYE